MCFVQLAKLPQMKCAAVWCNIIQRTFLWLTSGVGRWFSKGVHWTEMHAQCARNFRPCPLWAEKHAYFCINETLGTVFLGCINEEMVCQAELTLLCADL